MMYSVYRHVSDQYGSSVPLIHLFSRMAQEYPPGECPMGVGDFRRMLISSGFRVTKDSNRHPMIRDVAWRYDAREGR